MRYRILGPLQVCDGDRAVHIGGPMPQRVLALLLLDANQPVSEDRLAVALWGDEQPEDPRAGLRPHLSRLRTALGDRTLIARSAAGYRLRVEKGELDSHRLTALIANGRQALRDGDAQDAGELLREALALWRGPPLANVTLEEQEASAAIAQLVEQRAQAFELRVDADFAVGRHLELVAELREAVARRPPHTRESLCRRLMLALYRSGRQAEAIAAYHDLRDALSDEVGLEPGRELRLLYERIIRDDQSLLLALPVLPPQLAESMDRPLIGRAKELAWLLARWERVRKARRGARVAVVGSPGSGKTRLVAELAARVVRDGVPVLIDEVPQQLALVITERLRSLHLAPVLLVVTASSDPGLDDVLPLGPLDDAAVGEIAELYDVDEADVVARVASRSGGLPRAVHELLGAERRRSSRGAAGARRRLHRTDVLGHWSPRARGVEFATDEGDFFQGRTAALRALVDWLASDGGTGSARVVTGRPGSGKSALLARIAMLSDAGYRTALDTDRAPPDTVPPLGAVDVAVHVRGKTINDLAAELAAELGCDPTIPLVIDAAARRPRPLVVLVDALDEALDPRAMAREALRPLIASGSVKLLVGTRHHVLATLLAPGEAVLDLDRPEFFDADDVRRYVERSLACRPASAYLGSPELVRRVASEVARRAGSTFLVARLAAGALADRPDPIDPDEPDWELDLPDSVDDAFDEWLDRFADEKPRVRDLLRPLAFAEGAGLPWETLWPALAGAMAGRDYGYSDIEWALEVAGALIVEDREHGRPVYRLFHQALADHLRPDRRGAGIQRTIVNQLRRSIPREPDGTHDWRLADPYIRAHLATHAAAGGVLDDLLTDPDYLVAADPVRLLQALPTVTRAPSATGTGHPSAIAEALYREITAGEIYRSKVGAASRARRRPRSAAAYRGDIEPDAEPMEAVAVGRLGERPIAVAGGTGGALCAWDLSSGRPLGEPRRGHRRPIWAVAAGDIHGRPIAISGSLDRTLRVWDLATAAPIGAPLRGHGAAVWAVATGELDGRPIAVSSSFDQTLRVWDLGAGEPIGEPVLHHTDAPWAVAVGELEGRAIAVTGSLGRTLRIWDLTARAPIGEPLHGHAGPVWAVAAGSLCGRAIAVSGSVDHTLRVWDLAARAPITERLRGHTGAVWGVAVGDLEGHPVAVSASRDGTLRVWNLATGMPLGEPLRGHTDAVWAVAISRLGKRSIAVSAGSDRTIRVWDLATGAPIGGPLHRDRCRSTGA